MARGRNPAVRQGRGGKGQTTQVEFCPLCIEPLDDTERAFYPCPCGYQVCLFCLGRLKDECGNLCPGCRTEYGSEKNPFSKPAVRARTAARAAPAPRQEQPPATEPTGTDSHFASSQISPSLRARPLTPHVEQTANGLRPASAKLPSSSARDPAPPRPAGSAAPTSGEALSSHLRTQPAWQDQAQPESQELATSLQPTTQLQSATETDPEVSPAHIQHKPRPAQMQPAVQPQSATIQHVNGRLPSTHNDAAVRWVFDHLGLEQMPAVAPDPKGQLLLQHVRSALAAGQMTLAQGADQLVAFIQQRGTSSAAAGASSPAQPAMGGAAPASNVDDAMQQQLYSHLPQAATGNGPSIWGTSISTAWPSARPSAHSIWADAASPYTVPTGVSSASEVSRLGSLWGAQLSTAGAPGQHASAATASQWTALDAPLENGLSKSGSLFSQQSLASGGHHQAAALSDGWLGSGSE